MEGLKSCQPLPHHLSLWQQVKSQDDIQNALSLVAEYEQVGAVLQIPEAEAKHLIPWFIVTKSEQQTLAAGPDSDLSVVPPPKVKRRLIVDARELNQWFTPRHFKMDHWGVIYPYLQKNWWC
jgi:hypothetical protein